MPPQPFLPGGSSRPPTDDPYRALQPSSFWSSPDGRVLLAIYVAQMGIVLGGLMAVRYLAI